METVIDNTPNQVPLATAEDWENNKRKNREPKHLPWYKTQFWDGFIFGCQLGLLAGLPFAFVLYWVAVKVVHFIEGMV